MGKKKKEKGEKKSKPVGNGHRGQVEMTLMRWTTVA